VIHPGGVLGGDNAVELRRTIVHAVRRLRPLRLVVDLRDLHELDAINLGTLAAACHVGDDHHVAVFLDHPSPAIAERLTAAGVPVHRLRHSAPAA
jgi:anti-anti-sigma regulatory factor